MVSALIDSAEPVRKCQPCSGVGASVALEIFGFLCGGDFGRFSRIEADGDDVELVADVELDHLHRAAEAGERFSAKHGAVVVDEVEDQRLLAEVVAEFDGAACVVDEGEIGGNLRVEMLLDADVLQIGRTDVGRRRHDALGHRLGQGLVEALRAGQTAVREFGRCFAYWPRLSSFARLDSRGRLSPHELCRMVRCDVEFCFTCFTSSFPCSAPTWQFCVAASPVCERTGSPRLAQSDPSRGRSGMRTVPAFLSTQS